MWPSWPFSLLYGAAISSRSFLYRRGWLHARRLPRPVISVGNLTTGGTGKTPLVAFIAERLRDRGHRPVILTRGYRSKHERSCFLLSDGTTTFSNASESGDEPYWLARKVSGVPVVVGRDRYRCASQFLERLDTCVFLLDDGFQHIQLWRDVNLLLLDATAPFGSGQLLPAGSLRERPAAMSRADAIVVTRSDYPFDLANLQQSIRRYNPGATVYFSFQDLVGLRDLATGRVVPVSDFYQRRVCAVSGIANPAAFESDLQHFQIEVVAHFQHRDHHRYGQAEVDRIVTESDRLRAEAIVTTEKDAVKLQALQLPREKSIFEALAETRMEDEKAFLQYIEGCVLQPQA